MSLPMLAFVLALQAPKPIDLNTDGPYDAAVPRPERVLGYELGSRITTFRDQEMVVQGIANAARARVRAFEYGKSVQGRPLRILAFSSPRNIERLEAIRKAHLEIAEGRDPGLENLPAIVWINQTIHGNEPASFESGMALMYTLAASRSAKVQKWLDDSVIIVNPVYNPDGHERFAVYYNSISRNSGEPGSFELQEPSVIHGRSNQYRFDMNRDRVAFSQAETRQEFAEFLRWRPQIYVDQHGQANTYFFPPEPMSINQNVDRARNYKWTDIVGRNIGRRFDERGFQYYIGDVFDLYFPGYLDSSTTLSGAIGMTHETDGGKYLAQNREDGSILTLRRGVEKHFVSAMAVIEASAANRKALLESCLAFKRKVVSGEAAGKFQRVVLVSDDPRPLVRLQQQIARAGIKSSFATAKFSQPDANDYWSDRRGVQEFPAGSLVVDMAQSQGAFAKALFEPGQNFEKEFIDQQLAKLKSAPEGEDYPGPESPEFYDLTGWSLPYAHNLKAWWCESRPAISVADALPPAPKRPEAPSTIGYAIPYRDQDDILAVFDALAAGVRGTAIRNAMTVGGRDYPAGTFVFVADRNEEGYESKLRAAANRRGAEVVPLTSSYPDRERYGPGSESIKLLRKPKIGIVFGNQANLAQVGSLWWTFDHAFQLPFTALSSTALNGDLSAYTAIIVPQGAGVTLTPKLREWVSGGGTIVATEGLNWALGNNGFTTLRAKDGDFNYIPGTLFRAELDPRSFLSYGYERPKEGKIPLAVPYAGDEYLEVRKEGGSFVAFADDDKPKLLSGWAWPDQTEKALRGTVWLQDVPVGSGHAILFTWNPTDRAMWPGLHKLLLNAILFGPS